MQLKNKVFWITGASSGIGKSLAIELSKYDVNLILSSRNKNLLEEVKKLCKNPDLVKTLPLDLENYQRISKLKLRKQFLISEK